MENFALFLGRFHPLLVHLPIGFLMLAFIMEVASRWSQFKKLAPAIPFSLLLGGIAGIGACILGYLLSWSGDYDSNALWLHQWSGIVVTIFAFGCYFLKVYPTSYFGISSKQLALFTQLALVGLLSIAGHYGGNLTHGSTYLTEYAPFQTKAVEIPPPPSVDSALVYHHIIAPILKKKCLSCHQQGKQKGGLMLNSPESIVKGGKGGAILVSGKAEQSELYKRVVLPETDEHFMPPDGKTPLTAAEVALIEWWINDTQHSFESRYGEVPHSESITTLINQRININPSEETTTNPSVDPSIIAQVEQEGFTIRSLTGNFEWVEVSMLAKPIPGKSNLDRLAALAPIQDQILWLNMANQQITDQDLGALEGFTNLQRLRLEKNQISNKGIKHLLSLNQLEVINLYGNPVNNEVLQDFPKFPKLQKVYLWQTAVSTEAIANFQKQYADIELELGIIQ